MNQKLEEFKKTLKEKKIAIIGAGISNLPLIEILQNLEYDITLFDQKSLNDLSETARNLIQEKKLKTFLGKDCFFHLSGFDVIFRSPSLLPTNPYLQKEQQRGSLITTEIEQVIRLAPCPVIGVTGSKGKTTTTTIIHHLLKNLGYSTYLGGNIGIPLFSKLEKMKKDDIVVLELSSFQLMAMPVSPHIAVVTNISPDHLDIHASYEEYISAKQQIFKNQTDSDILVLNQDDEIVKKFATIAKGEVRYFGESTVDCSNNYILEGDYITFNHDKVIDTQKLLLKGKHNYLNICAALNAIQEYINVSNEELEKIVSEIKGVSHRLEFVREINGIPWYNDSASTTPDKSLAGLLAFQEKIVLIAGGYDKNISYEPLAEPIINRVSKLILFGDTKNKIYDAVMKLKKEHPCDIQIYVLDSLEEVVSVAYEVSKPGEVVLFSPASASFDMFQNAYQRGDMFKELVSKL